MILLDSIRGVTVVLASITPPYESDEERFPPSLPPNPLLERGEEKQRVAGRPIGLRTNLELEIN